MFSYLWKTAVGDSASESGWKSGEGASTDDERGLDDDAAAERLLTQFPAYGTNVRGSFDEDEDDEDHDGVYDESSGRVSPRGGGGPIPQGVASGGGTGGTPPLPHYPRRHRTRTAVDSGGGSAGGLSSRPRRDGGSSSPGKGKSGRHGGRARTADAAKKGKEGGHGSLPWDADEMDLWHEGSAATAIADDSDGNTDHQDGGADPLADDGAEGRDASSRQSRWRDGRRLRRRRRMDWSNVAAAAEGGARSSDSDDEASFSSSSDFDRGGWGYDDSPRQRNWSTRKRDQELGAPPSPGARQRKGPEAASSDVDPSEDITSPDQRKTLSLDSAGRVALLRRRRMGVRRAGGDSVTGRVAVSASSAASSSDGALLPGEPSSGSEVEDERESNAEGDTSESASGADSDRYGGRQHWMPDQLCRHCYSCEAPFTVFRRRHHCRLCGQVFCSACSSYFVEVPAAGEATVLSGVSAEHAAVGAGMVDVKVKSGDGSVQLAANGSDTVGSGDSDPSSSLTDAARSTMGSGSARTMRACKMCFEQVASRGLLASGGTPGVASDVAVRPVRRASSAVSGGSLQRGSAAENRRGSAEAETEVTAKPPHKGHTGSSFLPSAAAIAGTETLNAADEGIAGSLAGYDGPDDLRELSLMKKKADEERKRREEEEMVRLASAAAVAAAAAIGSDAAPSEAAAAVSAAVSPEGAQYKAFAHSAPEGSQRQPGARGQTTEGRTRFARKISGRLGKRFGKKASSRSIDRDGDKGESSSGTPREKNSKTLEVVSESGRQEDSGEGSKHMPARPVPTVSTATASTALTSVASGNSAQPRNDNLAKSKQITSSSAVSESRRLGLAAANHLEKVGRDLLETDAPLLLEEATSPTDMKKWVNMLMTLATRCCATVRPDVKKGDLLDIRPYAKIKVIPGGDVTDCAYMSGIIFRKTVSHKSMAREISNPRIMLLSGGIEYTRTENRIASLDTLLEQEEKYLEILVTKIIKLKPDVLMVGRSVSRKAQELLLRADVVLLQHVKSALMGRIARQTGATILSSTDHVMNQFGTSVLGKCSRFRLVTFRDNGTWFNESPGAPGEKLSKSPQSINDLLADSTLPHHKRQAVLAANSLGEGVIDGAEAVKSGLAKRGVTLTYAMVEGCPKQLGCTVVLRGASRPALKQVKRVFRFLVNVAYNLRLETSYLRERCAKLPSDYELPSVPVWSSSLCVDYGSAPHGRKVRPWNGGNSNDGSISGKICAFDHQSILITSIWMTGKNQCCPAEVKGICYYSMQDVSLGQFLRDSCFNLSLKCQNQQCKKSVLDHSLSFIHNDGLINITVEQMDDPLPPAPLDKKKDKKSQSDGEAPAAKKNDSPIATWSYCVNCAKVVTRLVYVSEDTWNLSFGKFLEIFFYNRTALLNSPEHGCSCQMQTASTLYFGCGRLAARFTYERIRPYGVHIRRSLPVDDAFHRADALKQLELVSVASSDLFIRFDKHIEKISQDARQLFGSAANKPEHLQTVLSELNSIGSEVDNAAKTLQEKFASVTNKYQDNSLAAEEVEALLRFPWYSRRYLFMLMGAWNERLSAAGQTLAAMKKLAASSRGGRGDTDAVNGTAMDGSTDEVMDGMKRLRQLREAYSRFNVNDMSMSYTGRQTVDGQGIDDNEYHDMQDEFLEYDEDFNMDGNGMLSQPDDELDFSDAVDADVLASRRRLQQQSEPLQPRKRSSQYEQGRGGSSRGTKSLGSRRQLDSVDDAYHRRGKSPAPRYQRQVSNPYDSADTRESSKSTSQQNKSRAVSAGGAVKSAFNRFFNRGNKEYDPYVVDLDIISEGRPRLEPGTGGRVVPIFDDQPSSIIAHSLASSDYDIQFRAFSKAEGGGAPEAVSTSDEGDRSIEDFFAGRGGLEGQNRSSREGSRQSVKKSVPAASFGMPTTPAEERKDMERRMLVRNKSHIKHTFRDFDEKGQQICKFVCTTYWATQFHAVRQAFLSPQAGREASGADVATPGGNSPRDVEIGYVQSLSAAFSWAASGGKSGASFSRTADGRFVVKCISRTELQMFLDCAPAYFEYLSKAFFHGLPTVLCKIVGVYQIGYHNRVTGRKTMEQVAVMQNIFHGRKISRIFDLKGSLRGRFTQQNLEKNQAESSTQESQSTSRAAGKGKHSRRSRSVEGSSESDSSDVDSDVDKDTQSSSSDHTMDEDPTTVGMNKSKQGSHASSGTDNGEVKSAGKEPSITTLLDGDFLEFTGGRPLPLNDRAKAVFHMSILNDTLFLSIINVLDYSILVGVDEERMELVVGIIDFMRQYDILKQMERVGKSLPMVVGSEAPTIIQPPLYKQRFTNAMERYFATVPSKWTTI